jgi:uncharacterized DUF497 family protein
MRYELFGIAFEWDDLKAQENEQKHGVTFEEAAWTMIEPATAFFDDPDHSGQELRQIAVGFSDRNRVVFVSFTRRELVRIISARKATANEQRQFTQRFPQ